ncbi:nuclear transport factor 2 family protein [Nocardia arizonensis]|uniref:nuclear transport factor 2 family protein n=1 Tax=Nocardia arizonensis TaxID=1141647 RepID=UPI0006D25CDA|nr:nuclear transport factor 2 family protein [Nocardia arizonensis]
MSAHPREVFTRLLTGVTENRFTEIAQLYAEDCVVEAPFALPEPTRYEGRAALTAHLEASSAHAMQVRADNIVIHETTDPEVIVAEWDYHIRLKSGDEVKFANIQVMRVRDGLIVTSRDFHNHAAMGVLA